MRENNSASYNPDQASVVPEKIISSEPKLRNVLKSLELLKPVETTFGEERRWQELWRDVEPFDSMQELSDNVRKTVSEFIASHIPRLKEQIGSISEFSDSALLNALANGWFEELDEDIDGQRRKVLLAEMAHVVRRIETTIYKRLLEHAGPDDLGKIGLAAEVRDLLIDVLDTSVKADPLFVRYLAFTQLSGRPPKEANETSLFIPDDPNPHTIAELFPHETQYLAKRFATITENPDAPWVSQQGGPIFRKYLQDLSRFYAEQDPATAKQIQKDLELSYGELVVSDFPIVITTGFEGELKPPYNDPELRVSVKTADTKNEERHFERMRDVFADNLSILNAQQFSETVRKQPVRIMNVLGNYGVNLTFSAVAQEDPPVLFLNEQIRAYDREFPEFMRRMVKNTDQLFSGIAPAEQKPMMERMSRANSVLHELDHSLYDDDSPEAKRLGVDGLETITDAKAEIVYRALVPSLIEQGGLEGTKEQWAGAMLASSILIIIDQPEDDDYFRAAAHSLNNLLQQQAVHFDGTQLEIRDVDAYYRIQKEAAQQVLGLYRDESMNEKKAETWINKNCKSNRDVKKLKRFFGRTP